MTNVIPLVRPIDFKTLTSALDRITYADTTAVILITTDGGVIRIRAFGEPAKVADLAEIALEELTVKETA